MNIICVVFSFILTITTSYVHNGHTKETIIADSTIADTTIIYNKDIKIVQTDYNNSLKTLPINTINDLGEYIISPIKWNKTEIITNSFIASATVGSIFLDRYLKTQFQNINSSNINSISKNIGKIGSFPATAIGISGSYFTSLIIKSPTLKNASLTSAEGVFISSIFTVALKYAIQRERPLVTNDNLSFRKGKYSDDFNLSFPSGHSSRAFVVATVFAEAYKESHPYIPYVAYTTASLIGISRINDNKHWLSDVFIGSALGYSVGKFISNKRLIKNNNVSNINLSFHPGVHPNDGALFTLSYNFNDGKKR